MGVTKQALEQMFGIHSSSAEALFSLTYRGDRWSAIFSPSKALMTLLQ
jgi:hypothetical protein